MSFFGNHLCTSFKLELLRGEHNFSVGGHVFKLALYSEDATLDAGTTAYTTANEIAAVGDYSAGGVVLSQTEPAAGNGGAYVSFTNVTLTASGLTARGALIYNSSLEGNPAVAVLDFGAVRFSSGGQFRIVFPAADPSAAIVRIL
jgi:hypothetical protein